MVGIFDCNVYIQCILYTYNNIDTDYSKYATIFYDEHPCDHFLYLICMCDACVYAWIGFL